MDDRWLYDTRGMEDSIIYLLAPLSDEIMKSLHRYLWLSSQASIFARKGALPQQQLSTPVTDHPLKRLSHLHQHKPLHLVADITLKDLSIHESMHVRLTYQRELPILGGLPQHKEIFRPVDQPHLIP